MNNRLRGQNVLRSLIAGIIAVFFYVLFTRIFADRGEALGLLHDHPYLSLGKEYTVEIFDLG